MKGELVVGLAVTHLALFGIGYVVADKRPVDTEVKNDGYFRVTTTKILATTIESLRDENRLLVFSYKGSAQVRLDRTWVTWPFKADQTLIVPAVVSYYVDMSGITLADVTFNEKAEVVVVRLPTVTLGEIAFQPEQATEINGGVVSWNPAEVEKLRKLNYANARRAMVAQAQQPGLLNAAKRQAMTNIENYFAIPLRIVGHPNIRVVATFQ